MSIHDTQQRFYGFLILVLACGVMGCEKPPAEDMNMGYDTPPVMLEPEPYPEESKPAPKIVLKPIEAETEVMQLTPPPATTVTYVVVYGDTFWNIAKKQLGDGQRWREIRDLNASVDPKKMRPGTKLRLPAK
jgi:5'-nucleotidase/UDP-sugar diphosphatase